MLADHKKQSYSFDELIQDEIFGPGSPKLPAPPMLMFDRIVNVSEEGGKFGKGLIEAELDIKPELWFFQCHFNGDPVMPGCLGLDAMWQLTGFYLGWMGHKGKGRALGVKDVKFTGQVLPSNSRVRYTVDIKRILNLKLAMVIADGQLEVDGETIYNAEGMRVGIFSNDDFGASGLGA